MRWHSPRRRFRAVTPIFAAVLMVGITVAAGVVLWSFRIQTPAPGIQVEYTVEGDQTEPAWGDPTDCTNTTIYASCDGVPAFFIVFTSHSPDQILLSQLRFEMDCNQTSLLNGTFQNLEVIPGSGSNPGAGSPSLGKCGSWKPNPNGNSATYFNRLAYFQQIVPSSLVLHDGDIFVVYEHPLGGYCDRKGNCPDDDYHGAPPWCFTSQTANCRIYIQYIGTPGALVATIPILQVGTTA